MMIRSLLIVFACLALFKPAQAAPPSDALTVSNAMLQQVRTAWAAGDGLALGRLYAADGDLITPYGVRSAGPVAVAAFYQGAFSIGYKGSDAGATIARARYLAPGTVLADGRWYIRGAKNRDGSPRMPEEGDFTIVLRQNGGKWEIAALREYLRA